MAVDLTQELVPALRNKLNPPGEDLFPGATDDEWVGRLANGFYRARLAGLFSGYTVLVDDGLLQPIDAADDDLDRVQQQVIVLWAAHDVLRAKILALPTMTKAKAGPVESERQRSAQVLVQLLKDAQAELDELKEELAVIPGGATVTRFLDGIAVRTDQVLCQSTGWLN